MLTARQVEGSAFGSPRRGPGYDEVAVDEYLEAVIRTLLAYERGTGGTPEVRSADIDTVRLPHVKRGWFRRGYDAAAVDALLVKARETLRVHERSASE